MIVNCGARYGKKKLARLGNKGLLNPVLVPQEFTQLPG